MGACVLVALTSCSSSKKESLGFEEATPMSDQYTVGEDIRPPWDFEPSVPSHLIAGGGSKQTSAGSRTPEYNRDDFPIPDGTASTTSSRKASSRQNQPEVASSSPSDVVVEQPIASVPVDDSLPTDPGFVESSHTPKPKTSSSGSGKKSSSSSSGKKSSGSKKPAKKLSKPTMVTYKVRPGDNLSTIAKRSNTSVAAIRKASGLKGDTIYAGTTIKVPYTPNGFKGSSSSSSKKSSSSTSKKGKTSSSSSSSSKGSYSVKSGETIGGIAGRNGTTTAKILKANGMTAADARKIRPGQKLIIPKN